MYGLFTLTIVMMERPYTISVLRGWPFDPEGGGGGGWHFWSGQIIYFHHELGRKIYFRRQNIYFQPQQIFEKAKEKKTGAGEGGGVSAKV